MSKLKGINVLGPIVPNDSLDTFPTHMDKYGKGGYRAVQTMFDRDNIPIDRLEIGMLVYVIDEQVRFRLETIEIPLKSECWVEDIPEVLGEVKIYGYYDIAGSAIGNPDPNTVLMRFVTPRSFIIRQDFIDSQARVDTMPVSTYVLSVRKNNIEIGTITFMNGSIFGIFNSPVSTRFGVRDTLTVVSPETLDPVISDLEWTLVCKLV